MFSELKPSILQIVWLILLHIFLGENAEFLSICISAKQNRSYNILCVIIDPQFSAVLKIAHKIDDNLYSLHYHSLAAAQANFRALPIQKNKNNDRCLLFNTSLKQVFALISKQYKHLCFSFGFI